MAAEKSPAFQFYPADWLSDERVIVMTPAQEGFYIRALCLCWRQGSIPEDDSVLALILAKGPTLPTKDDLRVVKVCFERVNGVDGRLQHGRLEIERKKQATWAEKSSAGGRKSVEVRKLKRLEGNLFNEDGSTTLKPPIEHPSNSSSSSSDQEKNMTNEGAQANTKPSALQILEAEFERARSIYPGTRRGHDIEWAHFKKKFTKQMPIIVPILFDAVQRYTRYVSGREKKYVKHFQGWINNQMWASEYPSNAQVNGVDSGKKTFYDPLNL